MNATNLFLSILLTLSWEPQTNALWYWVYEFRAPKVAPDWRGLEVTGHHRIYSATNGATSVEVEADTAMINYYSVTPVFPPDDCGLFPQGAPILREFYIWEDAGKP